MVNKYTIHAVFSLVFMTQLGLVGCQSTRHYKAKPLIDDFNSNQQAGLYMQIKWDGESKQDADSKSSETRSKNKKAKEPTIVIVVLENIETGKLVEIEQRLTTRDEELDFWQIPVGPYYLDSMRIEGTNFKTSDDFGDNVYTKSGTLANLGLFYIRPKKNSNLLIVKKKPLIYHQLNSEFGFEGVKLISAYTGKLQKVFAPTPKPIQVEEDSNEIAETNSEVDERERVKINVELKERDKTVILTPVQSDVEGFVTEVSYKVKLKSKSELAPKIALTLSKYEEQMQECYQGEIDNGSTFTGTLNYRFLLKKTQKKFKRVIPANKNDKQKKLNDCLISALRLMEFEEPVNLDGRIEIKFGMN